MPIDRTAYNALVDDDGSNTVGTPWTKNIVKTVLLDPIDALVGAWTAIAYAAGNFVGVGGGTWTVDSGDQVVYRYLKIGRLILVNLILNTTSVSGTVSSLSITLPVASAQQAEAIGLLFDNSGSVLSSARCYIAPGTTTLSISRVDGSNLAAATNNTYVRVLIGYEW